MTDGTNTGIYLIRVYKKTISYYLQSIYTILLLYSFNHWSKQLNGR